MASVYGNVTDADLYFAERGGATTFPEWFAATEPEKQTAHVIGTVYVDLRYEARMQGERTVSTQALAFPRTGVERHGRTLPTSEIPVEAKRASWEAAYRHLRGESLLPDAIDRSAGGEVESIDERLGLLSTRTTYRSGSQTNLRRFRKIDAIMRPLLTGGTFSGSVLTG